MSPRPPSPLIPRSDTGSAALFFVVIALCFLNAVASLGARFAWSATADWTSRATGELTIRIRGGEEATADALRIVADDPGIGEARLLPGEEARALLDPWLGGAAIPEDLPLPGLIAAVMSPGLLVGSAAQIPERVADRLSEAGISFDLDNHADFVREIERTSASVRGVLLLILLLLWATTLAVISFATRAALAARRDIVEILHLSGAQDSFIASLFERRFFGMGLRAGIIGTACALLMAGLVAPGLERSERFAWLIPQLSLAPVDAVILLFVPGIAGVAAMGAARATAMRALSALA